MIGFRTDHKTFCYEEVKCQSLSHRLSFKCKHRIIKRILWGVLMNERNERQSPILYMSNTITVIQYFVTVSCLVRQCADCEVNFNWFTETAYQIYISYNKFLSWPAFGTAAIKHYTRCKSINELLNTDILVQELPKMGTWRFLTLIRLWRLIFLDCRNYSISLWSYFFR
jgi:hypothetical protein